MAVESGDILNGGHCESGNPEDVFEKRQGEWLPQREDYMLHMQLSWPL